MTHKYKVGDKVIYTGKNHYDLKNGSVYDILLLEDSGYFEVIDDIGEENGCVFDSHAPYIEPTTWTPATPDYTPQDNHEVSYHMGIATHWREVEVVPDVRRVEAVIQKDKLQVYQWGFEGMRNGHNAAATRVGNTWTIEMDE